MIIEDNPSEFGRLIKLVKELNLEPAKEIVHVGRISHRHGDNFYVSRTEEDLKKQIAEYCRDWWGEFCTDECPADDQEAIDTYFGEAEGVEYCDVSQTEIE